MKTIFSVFLLCIAISIFSCKKEEEQKDNCSPGAENYPDSLVTGRLVFRNTNTPVANGIINLFNVDFNQGVATPVEMVGKVSNAEGYFTVDSALVRQYIYARRSDGEFCEELMSCAVQYTPTPGELFKIELTPFSWIKVTAIDGGTPNPEVTSVSFYASMHSVDLGGGAIVPLLPGEPFIFRTLGSENKSLDYRLNASGSLGPFLGTSTFWTSSLDTTEVVIFY